MAIQNFSGGGFYGRMGSVVGFRKYGKFVLREWVKGTNPQTPAQQAHRGAFSEFSKVASYALNVNRRSGVFDYHNSNEYSLRVKTASRLSASGASFLDAYPLFPFGYTPEFQSTEITLISQTADEVHLQAVGALPPVARAVGAIVAFFDSELEAYDIEYTSGTITPATTGAEIVLKSAWFGRWDPNTEIVIISQDDESFSGTTYWQRQTTVKAMPIPEREFDFSVRSFTRNGRIFTLTFNEPFFENTQETTEATLSCVSAGEIVSVSLPSVSFVNQGGYFGITFAAGGTSDESILAFPSGSSISFPFVKIYGENMHLVSTAPVVALTSSDLARGATLSAGAVSHVPSGLSFSFSAPSGVLSGGTVNISYTGWTLFENKAVSGTALARFSDGKILFDFLPSLRSDWCLPSYDAPASRSLSLEVTKNGVTYTANPATLATPSESSPSRTVTMPSFDVESESPDSGFFAIYNANIFPDGYTNYITQEYAGSSIDYFDSEGWVFVHPTGYDVTSSAPGFEGLSRNCDGFTDSAIVFSINVDGIPGGTDIPTVFNSVNLEISQLNGNYRYALTTPTRRVTFPY